MLIFDAAMKEICEVRRVRTSTPLQALNLLNDPQILEASRVMGYQLIEDTALPTEKKIETAFRKITSRKPTAREIDVLMQGYNDELERFKANPVQARKFLKVGAYPQKDGLDPVACAAMMHVVSIIYNLDEAISKS